MDQHNVFISYHHANDQAYKEELIRMNNIYGIFNDYSVNTGDISDAFPSQAIRAKIRDEYLRNSTVTILLVGTETWGRKHVDWELYSSMFDGTVNKKSGILVINLPSTDCDYHHAPRQEEKKYIHPECASWISITERSAYEERYPLMPDRIVDNLLMKDAKISVVPWRKIYNKPDNLRLLIALAHQDRATCAYDLSRDMRMRDA